MGKDRTGGMTTIGILNIVFGGIGTLIFLFAVVLGGLFAAGGAAVEAEAGPEAAGFGSFAAGLGAFAAIVGIIGLISSVLLTVSGIGVLKVAPWGRTLSILCGGVMALLGILSLTGGIDVFSLAFTGYGILLVALFFNASWKQTFSASAATTPSIGAPQEYKSAA